jgi:hypothetical protein
LHNSDIQLGESELRRNNKIVFGDSSDEGEIAVYEMRGFLEQSADWRGGGCQLGE